MIFMFAYHLQKYLENESDYQREKKYLNGYVLVSKYWVSNNSLLLILLLLLLFLQSSSDEECTAKQNVIYFFYGGNNK